MHRGLCVYTAEPKLLRERYCTAQLHWLGWIENAYSLRSGNQVLVHMASHRESVLEYTPEISNMIN